MTRTIANDLSRFTTALNEGRPVMCNHKGEWWIEGKFMRFVRWLFGYFLDSRVSKVARVFNAELDKLEKIPVLFNTNSANKAQQEVSFKPYFDAAAAIKKVLEANKSRKMEREQLSSLNRRVAAVKYRLEEANGGLNTAEPNSQDVLTLENFAKEWKESYDLYQDVELSEGERAKLQEACSYPEFATLLTMDKSLRMNFFKWALRDNNDVKAFVQFPSTCLRLKTALLSGRIGRFANDLKLIRKKKVKEGEGRQKVFTLPVEIQDGEILKTKSISILNEKKRVNLKGDWELTIKKVLDVFKRKNDEVGNLEFINGKICNWNVHELGDSRFYSIGKK